MSSPLDTFRKYRTYWMAGLVLLAIMAFIVAPAIEFMQGAMRNQNAGDQVVVRWSGGRITAAELERSRQQHYKFVRFLGKLANEVLAAGGTPQIPEFTYAQEYKEILDLGVNAQSDNLAVIETRLLADLAKQNGIEFDDDAADAFLVAYCDARVSPQRLSQLLRESTDNQLSEFELRELIKLELGAIVARQMALRGWSNEFKPNVQQVVRMTQTPGDLWADFLKLNHTAKVEAFPVLVSDYVKDVAGSPSEAEILAIYEEGKNRFPSPIFPEPGFMRDYKANFEYVQANFNDWVEREKAKVTEEQLKAEYDKRVALGQLKYDPSLEKPKTPEAPAGDKPADAPAGDKPAEPATPPASETPAETKPAEPAPATEAPKPETPAPTEPAAPATEPKAEPAAEPTSPAPAEPAPSEPAPSEPAPAPGTEPAAPAPGGDGAPKQSANSSASAKIRLVSAQDEPKPAAETPATETPATETPAAPAKETPAAPAQAGSDLPPVVVQPDAPATTTPATQAPTGEAPATPAGETPPAETPAAPTGTAPAQDAKPELRTKTFEEAREELLKELAQSAAVAALDKALNGVNEQMIKYSTAHAAQAAMAREGLQSEVKATRPDLKKLATEAGLIYGETGVVDRSKVVTSELGKSIMRSDDPNTRQESMPNATMNPSMGLFSPRQSFYIDQMSLFEGRTPDARQYIFWKTSEQQAYVPNLPEVRDDVINAWKTQKARELAEKAAEAIAKKITDGEQAWKGALSVEQQALVVTTDPFTWLSGFGETPRISNIPTLDTVGEEFMKQVFDTEQGKSSSAPNNGKNVYYVFRVVDKSPTINELQDRFVKDPTKSTARRVAMSTGREIYTGLYETIESRLAVEWLVPPSELSE